MHGGTQQLGVFRLELELPLLHLIQKAVEVLTKLVKLFDTAVFHPAGEVTVSTNVMHHVGDVLQGRDHPVMQRLGNSECDDGCKENTACQNGKRHPDEMADQAVTRGKANFANRCAVMHDGLRNRYGEKPAADQCAQRIVVVLRVPGPVGKPLFMRVNNLGHGKLALFAQGGQRFVGRQRVVEHQRRFQAVAHCCAG